MSYCRQHNPYTPAPTPMSSFRSTIDTHPPSIKTSRDSPFATTLHELKIHRHVTPKPHGRAPHNSPWRIQSNDLALMLANEAMLKETVYYCSGTISCIPDQLINENIIHPLGRSVSFDLHSEIIKSIKLF